MIGALIKLRLSGLVSGIASKNKKGEFQKPSKAKVILFALLYFYIIAFFTAFATVTILGIGSTLIPAGLSAFYFGIVSALSFAIIFIFSIFETKSELFDCKDNELILSMPIKPGEVVVSRILVVLIYNYLICALFSVPSTVIYAIYSGGDIKGIIGSVLTFLATPLAATALASAVGYAIALLSKRMKNKTLATMIFSIAFLALYFWGYTALIGSTDEGDISAALIGLADNLGFIGEIGKASLLYPLNTVIFIAACTVLALGAYALISKFYFSIITANHSSSRTKYKKKELKKSSSIVALTGKELSKIASSATYMLNCGLAIIFMLALAVFAIIKKSYLAEIAGVVCALVPGADATAALAFGFSVIILTILSTATFSSCALSLEGDSLWIVKSMPLSAHDILISKAIPHIIIVAPVSLVTSLFLSLAGELDFVSTVFVFVTPLAAVVFSAFFGVILNVLFPKFKFNNEVEVIKQSASVFLMMLTMMILALIGFGAAVLGVMFSLEVLMQILLTLLMVALAFGAYFILVYGCAKRFEKF